MFALVGANAFFVIGEYAVVTARRAVLNAKADAGSAGARIALRLMEDPVRVISSVQVGITALGILTGAIGEPLVRELLGDWLPGWAGFTLAFAIVTFLSVVLGELVPKALTLDRAETLAALVAPAIDLQARLLRPIVWVLQGTAALLLRPFGVGEVVAGDSIRSADELRALVDEAEQGGVIPADQEELLLNVLDFASRDVRDVMVPAGQVAWLRQDATIDEALDEVVEQSHSRYPVGRETLDELVGVAHVRDLVAAARRADPATVGDVIMPAVVVPQFKDLRTLLQDLRSQRQQLAVVVDEYGSVAGIVTLEDMLEQLVGDIEDEHDAPGARVEELADGSLRVPGTMSVDGLARRCEIGLPREGPRTIGGLVFERLGRRPEVGDAVRLGELELVVDEVDGVRVATVLARR